MFIKRQALRTRSAEEDERWLENEGGAEHEGGAEDGGGAEDEGGMRLRALDKRKPMYSQLEGWDPDDHDATLWVDGEDPKPCNRQRILC